MCQCDGQEVGGGYVKRVELTRFPMNFAFGAVWSEKPWWSTITSHDGLLPLDIIIIGDMQHILNHKNGRTLGRLWRSNQCGGMIFMFD